MQYFGKKADEYDTQVLALASVVAVANTADFVEYTTNMLCGTVKAGTLLLSGLAATPKQRMMSFDAFIDLCDTLQQSKYAETIEGLKDRLVSSQMMEWEQLIKDSHALAAIEDAESIQAFLNELIEKYGSINNRLKEDITKSDKRFAILKACDVGGPNNKQFALSQYCVGNTYSQQRQFWIVPSG